MAIKDKIFSMTVSIIMFIAFTNSASAATYYWVGGSGNWGDFSGHWSTTSGGSTYYGTPPGGADDVIFDSNSGFTSGSRTVNVNIAALCASFTIVGTANAPIFTGSGILSIYADTVLQSGTTVNVGVNFLPTGNQTLTTNGVVMAGNVNISGAGSLSLVANTIFSNNLNLLSGTIDTQGFALTVATFTSSTGSSKTIKLGSSTVTISNSANFGGSNLIMQAGTSTLRFTKTNMDVINNSGDGLSSSNSITLYDVLFVASSGTGGINGSGSIKGRNLTFNANGAITQGSHTFQNVTVPTGKTLTLPANSTFTIGNKLTLGTSADVCSAFSSLLSTATGSPATLALPNNTSASIYHTVISDISVTPSGVVPQLKSYDNGGNTGWNFSTDNIGINYYWVGNTGKWSTVANWSVDDGMGGRIAAACLPSIIDDVIFDNSSFSANGQTVTVDAASLCHNISFIGTNFNPSLTGTFTLTVSGSSVWKSGMTLNVGIDYSTKGNQTITSNGVIHRSDVSLSGSNNSTDVMTLIDDFVCGSKLEHLGGTFKTAGFGLRIYSFTSVSNAVRTLNLSTTTVFVTGTIFSTRQGNLTLVANQANIRFINATSGVSMAAMGSHTFNDVSFEGSGKATLTSGKYNTLTFKDDGQIQGASGINTNILNFTSNKIYNFEGTIATHFVNQAFNASGTGCTKPIVISSSGTYFIKFGATATINVNWARIDGSKASRSSGTLPIIANNSTNLGQNSGWTFASFAARTLYWVSGGGNWDDVSHWSLSSGGSAGECPPRSSDDVFFDANSGFTSASRTINLNGLQSFSHDFTVSGVAFPLTFTGYDLSLSGSMELQSGTVYNISTAVYVGAGNTETLKTNGTRISGDFSINSGTNPIGTFKFLDNYNSTGNLIMQQGILDTSSKNITVAKIYDNGTTSGSAINRLLKFGSSTITITGSNQAFCLTTPGSSLEQGTYNVTFTGANAQVSFLSNILVNNLVFNQAGSILNGFYGNGQGGGTYGAVKYNSVIFKKAGSVGTGSNTFGTLLLTTGYTYQFVAGGEQFITDQLYASGNSCQTLAIKSTTAGTAAKLNISDGSTSYNYVVATDINATNKTIYLDINSTDGSGNTNIVFDTNGTKGTIVGLGPDKFCYLIKPSVPTTKILSASGFNGDPFTTYRWTKISGTPAAAGILGTGVTLDISATGYGTYRVNVDYGNCPISDDILVQEGSVPPTGSVNQFICFLGTSNTTVNAISIIGTLIKWYKDPAMTLPVASNATLTTGSYYATQTVNNNCESAPTRFNIVIDNCNMLNPNLRQRN